MQTAPFHPVASNSLLKYMNGSKSTYVKNLCFTAKQKGLPIKLYFFLNSRAILSCTKTNMYAGNKIHLNEDLKAILSQLTTYLYILNNIFERR